MSHPFELPIHLQKKRDIALASNHIIDTLIHKKATDAALLYLYVLRFEESFHPEQAKKDLGFSDEQLQKAWSVLIADNHFDTTTPSPKNQNIPSSSPPSYDVHDLQEARKQDIPFATVCDTAEQIFGRTLSEAQLRTLFMVYDYLKLPADVMIELLTYLRQQHTTIKRSDILREASIWADLGIYTLESATMYMKKQEKELPIIHQMQVVLHLTGRKLNTTELRTLSGFIKQGFSPDVIELAYKRCLSRYQVFSWKYLCGIVRSWAQKGLYTCKEIQAVEPEERHNPQSVLSPSAKKEDIWEARWKEEINKRQLEQKDDSIV